MNLSGGVVLTHDDGTEEVIYKPSPKQLLYHQATEPNVIMWGNRGGGKSICGRWDAHMRAMSYPGYTYCILRRTFPQLKSSHLNHIDREMELLGGTFHHTDKIAYYPNGSKGYFRHCSTPQDIHDLLSAEFQLMFFDELSTFEWEMFTTLSTSVRTNKKTGLTAMVRGATNPLGICAEEIQRYFIEKDVDPEEDPDYNPEDWRGIKIQSEDNEYLDLEQYKKRFAGLAAHVRTAWVDGEFSNEDALFSVRRNIRLENEDGKIEIVPYHYVDSIPLEDIIKRAQIYRAYDHGYSPDPAYCLWIAHLGNRYIAFHEKMWYKTIASDIAVDIVEETKNLGIPRVIETFCDPAIDLNTGADIRTIKDIMEAKGVPMECSVNSRELYASSIHQALGEEAGLYTPKLQIYTKGCPYLAKTLPKQRYDPKHPLRMANSKTDHAAVTLAYFLISSGSSDRVSVTESRGVRPWLKPKKTENWVLGKSNVRKRQNIV